MRPRPEEYIIRTKIGHAKRQLVWHCDKGIDLDLPHGWTLEKVGGRLRLRDLANPDPLAVVTMNDFPDGEIRTVNLPASKVSKLRRPLNIELRKLRPPRPVYVANPTRAALQTPAPKQLCAFYGQRYFLIRYRPVASSHTISFGSTKVFNFKKTAQGYTIYAQQQPLKVNIGGKKQFISMGGTLELTDVDFFRATVIQGIHWWRFRMVPTPDQQPPLETDETDDDLRESMRMHYSTVAFLSLFGAFLFSVYLTGKLFPPPPKPIHVEVTMKTPKVFPAFEEKKPLPPPPPPPEVAKVEPPPPPPPEPPPKKEKPPEVAKAKPKKAPKKVAVVKKPTPPKPVAKAKPTPEPVAAAPTPPAPVKDPGPTPEQLKAIQKAQEQAAEKQQMLKSLNFLSTSKSRPNVDTTTYENKEGKFAETAKVGGMTSKSNVLDKIAKGAPGDGSIKTKSGRGIASKLDFGKNKGLNDVQGKVSLGELQSKDGNPGNAMGGGKSLELSGPGELSESQIEKALSKFLSKFQYCYEKSLLSDSSLSGNLVVQWTVTTSGKAAESRVIKSQLNNEDLHKCVLKVLASVPFPKPKGGSVTVKKTFAFSSSAM